MEVITIYDYLLLPLYLAVFYFFIKLSSRNMEDKALKKVFITAFWLRMLGCILYSMLLQYYYGFGDSMGYFTGGNFINEKLQESISNVQLLFGPASEIQRLYDIQEGNIGMSGYIGTESASAVMRISSVISFVAFKKFLIISIFFGLFSFAGQWKLFKVFNDINKGKNQKMLCWAVLYTPSIWFWGSGLMKDSVCMGAAGFIIFFLYKNFVQKKFAIRDFIMIFIFAYLIFVIKIYIIAILGLCLGIFLFAKLIFSLKNIIIRAAVLALFAFVAISILSQSDFSSQIKDFAEESYLQVQNFQNQYQNIQNVEENSKATFTLSDFNASPAGLLLYSPVVIFTCLFRPFIWESAKPIIMLSSLESLALLLATLYLLIKLRVWKFFVMIFTNEYLLFCFVLSLTFAVVIGYTTFNWGTMVRYKIILLPFYYFMLVTMYNKSLAKTTGP